ncbi:MAG: AarF/ABC1/UbiB kinase family protein [Deltaproteobacteria bacterium]|nr:AarF/ABC1/UbiB kinase family protein [Deltaproteobacteria bacterium]
MERRNSKRKIAQRGRVRRMAGLAVRVGASYGRLALARALGLSGEEAASLSHAENAARILETAIALRGPFMKLIQLLGMQGDMLPDEYLDALSTLHDKAPPLPWQEIRPVFAVEFGQEPEKIFRSIDPEAIAAASLGQVYKGTLADGTPVAIKVQYPGVREAVARDLRVFSRILKAQKRIGADLFGIQGLDYNDMFADLETRLHEELDYRREATNIEIFRQIYRDWNWVAVPHVYREFSTDRVLTMDLLSGGPLGEILRSNLAYEDRERLRFRLAEMLDHEFYGVGIIHADPHPGNKLIRSNGQIQLLDFGCIKVLPRQVRDVLRDCVRTLLAGGDQGMLVALRDLGFYRDGLDPTPALSFWRFANRPLLVDGPYDGSDLDYRAELFQQLGDLSRHGYVHFAPHTLFMLRVFLGVVAVFRMLGATTSMNYRQRTIDFFANRLAEGDRIRNELERQGLIRAEE